MTDPTQPEPIRVPEKAAPVALSEGAKAMILGLCAMAVDHFMHSETAIIAVLAAAGFALTSGYGVVHHLANWRKAKFMANLLPNSVATVGKPS